MARRNTGTQARADELRPRVEETLHRLDHSKPGDLTEVRKQGWIDARKRFAETAIRAGIEAGKRVWKEDGTGSRLNPAVHSMQVLLKELGTARNGEYATGVNDHWVMDLWELALDVHKEELLIMDSEPIHADTSRPLGMRLLDAYRRQDGDAMIALVVEVDNLEEEAREGKQSTRKTAATA